ncbi:phosphotransferase [Botrimarina colliarenosi]
MKYAQLSQHMSGHIANVGLSLRGLEAARADTAMRREPYKTIRELSAKHARMIERTASDGDDKSTLYKLFTDHDLLLSECWDRVKKRYNRQQNRKKATWFKSARPTVVLQDFHPHNVFVDSVTHQCVLIFDYEGFGTSWSVSEALAFALHRFTREYVAKCSGVVGAGCRPDPAEQLAESVSAFLGGYEAGGGRIPSNAMRDLWRDVIGVTLNKWLAITAEYVDAEEAIHTHPHSLSEHTLLQQEYPKFVECLKEAKVYSLFAHGNRVGKGNNADARHC